jgi:hypothetical protein
LYDHNRDSNEWHNLAYDTVYLGKKQELERFLPGREAPLIEDYISPWSIEGADKERLKTRK